jgi:myosin-1
MPLKFVFQLTQDVCIALTRQDEECLRPGEVTDETFLSRLDKQLGGHKHYKSFDTAGTNAARKNFARGTFQISHYAGDVVYHVGGFVEKNNDLLFRDLKEAMTQTKNAVITACFPKEELTSLKRPATAATQFKNSLNQLVDILMVKTPWYVRCIKPNHNKRPRTVDPELLVHQVPACSSRLLTHADQVPRPDGELAHPPCWFCIPPAV